MKSSGKISAAVRGASVWTAARNNVGCMRLKRRNKKNRSTHGDGFRRKLRVNDRPSARDEARLQDFIRRVEIEPLVRRIPKMRNPRGVVRRQHLRRVVRHCAFEARM